MSKIITNPREKKALSRVRHTLSTARSTATSPLIKASLAIGEIVDLQLKRAEKLGTESPKRDLLEVSIRELQDAQDSLQKTSDVIVDTIESLAKYLDAKFTGDE